MTTASENPETTNDPVRVPNVHAHAVSGLDHEALGPDDRDALNVQEADLSTADGTEEQGNVVGDPDPMPDTTGLIATSETTDDTSGSAPAAESDEGDATGTDDGTQDTPGEELDPDPLVSEGGDPIVGTLVESDTAGTGEAVNAETGEVTPAGEQLPTIAQDGGTPLDPAETHDGTED